MGSGRPSIQSIPMMIPIMNSYDARPVLEPLRHFTLVAQHGTFTAAARHAHVTQPALTASIQRLEAQMGARLLRSRTGRRDAHRRGRGAPAARSRGAGRGRGGPARGRRGDGARRRLGARRRGRDGLHVLPAADAREVPRAPSRRADPRCARRTRSDLLDALEAGDLDLVILARVRPARRRRSPARRALRPRAREVGRRRDRPRRRARRRRRRRRRSSRSRAARRRARWSITTSRACPIAMELGSIAAVKGNTRAGVGVALRQPARRRARRRGRPARGRCRASARRSCAPLYLVHRGRDRLPPAAAELHRMLRAARRSASSVERDSTHASRRRRRRSSSRRPT